MDKIDKIINGMREDGRLEYVVNSVIENPQFVFRYGEVYDENEIGMAASDIAFVLIIIDMLKRLIGIEEDVMERKVKESVDYLAKIWGGEESA